MKSFIGVIVLTMVILAMLCSCNPVCKISCPNCGCDLKVQSVDEYNVDTMNEIVYRPTCVKEGSYQIRCAKCETVLREIKIPVTAVHRYRAAGGNWDKAVCADCGCKIVSYVKVDTSHFTSEGALYEIMEHQVGGYNRATGYPIIDSYLRDYLIEQGVEEWKANGLYICNYSNVW